MKKNYKYYLKKVETIHKEIERLRLEIIDDDAIDESIEYNENTVDIISDMLDNLCFTITADIVPEIKQLLFKRE